MVMIFLVNFDFLCFAQSTIHNPQSTIPIHLGNTILASMTTDNAANMIKMSVALISTLYEEEVNEDLPEDSWETQVNV